MDAETAVLNCFSFNASYLNKDVQQHVLVRELIDMDPKVVLDAEHNPKISMETVKAVVFHWDPMTIVVVRFACGNMEKEANAK